MTDYEYGVIMSQLRGDAGCDGCPSPVCDKCPWQDAMDEVTRLYSHITGDVDFITLQTSIGKREVTTWNAKNC